MIPNASTLVSPGPTDQALNRKSFVKLDPRTLALVGWSVAMSVAAQLTLRATMSGHAGLGGQELAMAAVSSPMVWAGLGLYLLATVTWLMVLSRIDLSVAYPLGSMNYVLVTLFAATVLGEEVGLLRWAGILSILIGILVVARGEGRTRAGVADR